MAKLVDFTGRKFGRLTAIEVRFKGRETWWLCRCDCGEMKQARASSLVKGWTKSCGCLRRERGVEQGRSTARHGMYKSPEYLAWRGARNRCLNQNDKSFAEYGGRGISVCDRWATFEAFFADMGSKPSLDHSLDRIDNERGYEPGNCRWATRREQQRNRRKSIRISFEGNTKQLNDWAEQLGIDPQALYSRIKRGWSVNRALTPGNFKHRGTAQGRG